MRFGFLAMWRYVEQPLRVVELAVAIVVAFGLRYDHGIYVGFGGLATVLLTSARTARKRSGNER